MGAKLKHETPSEHMKTHTYCERCYGVSIHEDIQNPAGHSSGQTALGDSA